MYQISDKASAIKAIQRLLGLNETGIYDKKLKEAVTLYQRTNSINESGSVNYDTYISLVERDKKNTISSIVKKNLPFLSRFPYSRGDMGNDVLFINTLISEVITKYGFDLNKPRGKYFGDDTDRATKFIGNIILSDTKDEIDELFIYRLMRLKEG